MKFKNPTAEIFIPGQMPVSEALGKTTHLCIAAHQDDIEIMAAQPILECFKEKQKGFTGVVVTDGRGSPRDGLYQKITDEEMQKIRKGEQHKAAVLGEYAALVLLDYPSTVIKDASNENSVEDILQILQLTKPKNVYTHNLADKHDTHVAVCLRVITALRKLEISARPERIIGCEVWRSLDWMNDPDKVVMDLSTHENLQHALLGVYDSQIAGGKRYDLAAMSRRRANATFFESHGVDVMTGVSFAMDLTPLMNNSNIHPSDYVNDFIHHLEIDVEDRIARMS
jgi:LmbE family N-acetylglucosaminyl deacetylase